MNCLLTLYLIVIPVITYGQVLSETSIIFESKKSIILNNGSEYKLVKETPLESAVLDFTIPITHVEAEKTLVLNRVLLIKKEEQEQELIEWITGPMKFYKLRNSKKKMD